MNEQTKSGKNVVIDTKNIGLRGIPVADTKIALVNGKKGELEYRGYNIRDLAKHSNFEEVAYLLLYGVLPTLNELTEFKKAILTERELPDQVMEYLKVRSASASSMNVLQSTIPILADFDPDLQVNDKDANRRMGVRLISKVATVVAAWSRIRKDLEPVKPDRSLSHAANFLYMMSGVKPNEAVERDINTIFILHADHSFNASTFAAREVTSTRAHMYAAVSAAVGALSGELHGGANTKVMNALLEIGEPSRVEKWVKARLKKGGRVMGMGHAVYKTVDPRAVILKEISKRIGKQTGKSEWHEMTQLMEKFTQKELWRLKQRRIYPNVDLYSAPVYCMLGIDVDLYTPVFAVQRMVGWVAHIIEEKFAEAQPKSMLYRPSAVYIGRYCGDPSCKYIPIEKRE